MEYRERVEGKKLYKEKKDKGAVEALNYEMAVNLLRVHNLYSDVKYDPEKEDYVAYDFTLYAQNSQGETIIEIKDYYNQSLMLEIIDTGLCHLKNFKEEKNVYNSSLKLRKK